MAIIKTYKQTTKNTVRPADTIKKVTQYCLPHMLTAVLIPFCLIVISLILGLFNLTGIAEMIVNYIAFPLSLVSTVLITLKQIYALRGAFPRETKDKNTVILSVLACSIISFILLINLFHISCYLLGIFPMSFSGAAYIRDMYTSSPAALNLFYVTIFFLISTLSIMCSAAYFIGYNKGGRFSFSYSCFRFIIMYVLLLVIFVLAYFIATFLDIIALERIQISSSIFNSSILCSFVTFILVAIPFDITLYFILRKNLLNIKKELHRD